MALTTLDAVFPLNTNEIGYITKSGAVPNRGEKFPINIPRIMPGIPIEPPKKSKITTRGAAVYKNAPGCSIRCDNVINSVNYIEGTFEGNKRWTPSQVTIDSTNGTRSVEVGLQVICRSVTNVVEQITFGNE